MCRPSLGRVKVSFSLDSSLEEHIEAFAAKEQAGVYPENDYFQTMKIKSGGNG